MGNSTQKEEFEYGYLGHNDYSYVTGMVNRKGKPIIDMQDSDKKDELLICGYLRKQLMQFNYYTFPNLVSDSKDKIEMIVFKYCKRDKQLFGYSWREWQNEGSVSNLEFIFYSIISPTLPLSCDLRFHPALLNFIYFVKGNSNDPDFDISVYFQKLLDISIRGESKQSIIFGDDLDRPRYTKPCGIDQGKIDLMEAINAGEIETNDNEKTQLLADKKFRENSVYRSIGARERVDSESTVPDLIDKKHILVPGLNDVAPEDWILVVTSYVICHVLFFSFDFFFFLFFVFSFLFFIVFMCDVYGSQQQRSRILLFMQPHQNITSILLMMKKMIRLIKDHTIFGYV